MNNTPSSESATKPTHEQISMRAELLWKAKGSPNGRDEEIWLEAERQLADEAREMIGGTSTKTLSSEEPAMPPEARQAAKSSTASEQMSSPPSKPAGGSRRRSTR